MLNNPIRQEEGFEQPLAELARLRRFTGSPAEFWPAFTAASSRLASAVRGLLILRDPNQPDRLKKLSDWASAEHADRSANTFTRALPAIVERCSQEGALAQQIEVGATPAASSYAIAVGLQLQKTEEKCIAVFLLVNATEQQAREALIRVQLVSDTPVSYQLNFGAQQAKTDVEKFASVLDIMVLVNAEKRFLAAALAFCNGLATRYSCDRVSLGWLQSGYVRLRAISRTERFDKHMTAVKALEVAMEEAFDQDEEILWPAPENSPLITRDHAIFARDHTPGNMCSIPLRTDKKPVAVLSCERQGKPFTPIEIQQLRLACDQAVSRLADLHRQDRWFGARWATLAKEQLAKLVGPEHTWAKVLSLIGVAALLILVIPIFTYRVEGKFNLRSDEVAFLTGPFDGYIQKVYIRPGDTLKKGDPMLSLDTRDLELEEASALAEQNRYLREAEKARAASQNFIVRDADRAPAMSALAEMRISEALANQTAARLNLIRYRLEQATLKAPFDGVLVEGDLRQRIGAPVKQGDSLFRVARLDPLYVEAEVNERDVHEILNKRSGEIAFVTQPKLKFPIAVERIEPAAFPKEGENVFVVRCKLTSPIQSWWRPGMSGVCKLDVERRSLFWILTHRTVDFLRMLLWW